MNFWRIKWENIFATLLGLILIIMTIKYITKNGFDLDVIMFSFIYSFISIIFVRWTTKMSRKIFLEA